MREWIVSIEREGNMLPVGFIRGETVADSCFSYSEEYLQLPFRSPISISLPLQEDAFEPDQTKRFFEGLLPEGFTRRAVAQWMHVEEDDYLALLHGLGRECLGALSITDVGETVDASYEKITAEEVCDLAAEGASRSAEMVTKAHLSLTGASGKVGLYYDTANDVWYFPWGLAPSTHIVKQSHVRLDAIVQNEQLCLRTAAKCGIEAVNSFIVNTGKGEDSEVLFATERYDRIFPEQPDLISGLPRPFRLHQEDFAQAMGISAAEKYEKDPRGYMKGMFELLRKNAADPVSDQLKLWDILVFDYLIGNTDAHIKNFSLLYAPNLQSLRLAPAYDIVSTTVYKQSTREMAFYIGGQISLQDISRESFRQAASEAGLGAGMAMRRFDKVAGRFEKALLEAAKEMRASGFTKADTIREQILLTGGFRKLGG